MHFMLCGCWSRVHNGTCDNLSCMMIRWFVPTSFRAATTNKQIRDDGQSAEKSLKEGHVSCSVEGNLSNSWNGHGFALSFRAEQC